MRKLLLLISSVISLCLPMHAQSALIPVTTAKLSDASGNLIASATLCGQLTANPGPISVKLAGGGQTTQPPTCTTVTNGVSHLMLPDTSMTNPVNPCIAITATDNTTGKTLLSNGYSCVQPTSAPGSSWCSTSNGFTSCNLDLYTPNFAPQALIQIGPQGPQGTPGCTVGNGSCNTVVSTTPAANQAITQPAGTSLAINGTALLNGKSLCAADGSGCPSNSRAAHVGVSADLTQKSENGSSEQFFADFHPSGVNTVDGSDLVAGFDYGSNVSARGGTFVCKNCSTAGVLVRTLTTPIPVTGGGTFTLQAEMLYQPGNGSTQPCVGFNSAAPGTIGMGFGQVVKTCLNGSGWYLVTPAGSFTEYAPPSGAGWYDMSMTYLNGPFQMSLCTHGTNTCISGYQGSPVATLTSTPLNNLEIDSASTSDQVRNVRYSEGSDGSTTSGYLNLPYSPTATNITADIPFLGANEAGSYVLLPTSYKPGVKNPWVMYFHGYGEFGYNNSTVGDNAGVAQVSQALAQAGYIVVGVSNSVENCYGNSACMTDVSNVIKLIKEHFAVADDPYLVSDSMGGLQMLNAVSQGLVHPRAMVGWCDNTNLYWDYYVQGGGGGAALIGPLYNVSSSNPYAVATAGYDPMTATGQALANLVAVPTQLWSSYGDTTVDRTQNSDLYANKINAAGGNVVVNTSTGNHEDPSNFVPSAVVAFFNAH